MAQAYDDYREGDLLAQNTTLQLDQNQIWSSEFDQKWRIKRLILWGVILLCGMLLATGVIPYESPVIWLSLILIPVWGSFMLVAAWCGLGLLSFASNRESAKKEEKSNQIASAIVWKCRGDVHYELELHQKAIADYSKAISLDSKYAGAYIRRGDVYKQLGQQQLAIEDYNQAISLTEQRYGYRNKTDAEAEAAYLHLGDVYQELKEHEKAIENYDKAIYGHYLKKINLETDDTDPEDAHVYLDRGDAYYELGQNHKAIDDYSEAIDRYLKAADQHRDEPNGDAETESSRDYAAICYARRARIYSELNQYQEAVDDYTQAINIDSDPNFMYYLERAEVHDALEQNQKMLDDCNAGMKLAPQNAKCYILRGYAYNKLGQYQNALNDYNVAIDPDTGWTYNSAPRAYLYRGDAYFQLGQFENANEDYAKAISLKGRLIRKIVMTKM